VGRWDSHGRWHGIRAAISVLLEDCAGALTNLSTQTPIWPLVTGTLATVLLWAGWEWRAARSRSGPTQKGDAGSVSASGDGAVALSGDGNTITVTNGGSRKLHAAETSDDPA